LKGEEGSSGILRTRVFLPLTLFAHADEKPLPVRFSLSTFSFFRFEASIPRLEGPFFLFLPYLDPPVGSHAGGSWPFAIFFEHGEGDAFRRDSSLRKFLFSA